jgi:hypothetical protein
MVKLNRLLSEFGSMNGIAITANYIFVADILSSSPSLCAEVRDFRELRKALSVPLDQGAQLLFKEMIAMRDHSEDMFNMMDTKMSKLVTFSLSLSLSLSLSPKCEIQTFFLLN